MLPLHLQWCGKLSRPGLLARNIILQSRFHINRAPTTHYNLHCRGAHVRDAYMTQISVNKTGNLYHALANHGRRYCRFLICCTAY